MADEKRTIALLRIVGGGYLDKISVREGLRTVGAVVESACPGYFYPFGFRHKKPLFEIKYPKAGGYSGLKAKYADYLRARQ